MNDFDSLVETRMKDYGITKPVAFCQIRQENPRLYESWEMERPGQKVKTLPRAAATTQPEAPKTVSGGAAEYWNMVKAYCALHGCSQEAAHVAVTAICPSGRQAFIETPMPSQAIAAPAVVVSKTSRPGRKPRFGLGPASWGPYGAVVV